MLAAGPGSPRGCCLHCRPKDRLALPGLPRAPTPVAPRQLAANRAARRWAIGTQPHPPWTSDDGRRGHGRRGQAGRARARARRRRRRRRRPAGPRRAQVRHAARRGDRERPELRVALPHVLLLRAAGPLHAGPGSLLLRLLLHRLRPRGGRRPERRPRPPSPEGMVQAVHRHPLCVYSPLLLVRVHITFHLGALHHVGVRHPSPRRRQAQVGPARRRVLRAHLDHVPPRLYLALLLPYLIPESGVVRGVSDAVLYEKTGRPGPGVPVLQARLRPLLAPGRRRGGRQVPADFPEYGRDIARGRPAHIGRFNRQPS